MSRHILWSQGQREGEVSVARQQLSGLVAKTRKQVGWVARQGEQQLRARPRLELEPIVSAPAVRGRRQLYEIAELIDIPEGAMLGETGFKITAISRGIVWSQRWSDKPVPRKWRGFTPATSVGVSVDPSSSAGRGPVRLPSEYMVYSCGLAGYPG